VDSSKTLLLSGSHLVARDPAVNQDPPMTYDATPPIGGVA